MGDTLAKPVTEKNTCSFDTPTMHLGACGMQGWRKKMEDAHTAEYQVEKDRRRAFIAVFDGHNGQGVAKHCSLNLLRTVQEQPAYEEGDMERALIDAHLQLDEKIRVDTAVREDGGCTAVSVFVTPQMLYCANVGDSRAVVCRNGVAEALSVDHRPTLPSEQARVEAAGGTVDKGRVGGTLSLTRAMGDFEFKDQTDKGPRDQVVIALPDVTKVPTREVEFIVAACDGVYDVMTNEELVRFIRAKLDETNGDVPLVCEAVLDDCMAKEAHGLGTDNMTIVLLLFKPRYFEEA